MYVPNVSIGSSPSIRTPPMLSGRNSSPLRSMAIQTKASKSDWNGIEVERISNTGSIDDIVVMGKKLGKGAFGEVRQGVYQGKPVAVKMQKITPKMIPLLVKEIDALKLAKDHGCGKYVNEIYDVVLDEKRSEVYFIMELLDGKELKKYIDEMPKGELLSERQIMDILAPLKLGLDCLHDSGIAHRDVKPGNAMLQADGSAKWIDLGLACVRSCSNARISGTPSTLAPEVVAFPINTDVHALMITDMWSFGCVAYYITTRRNVEFQLAIADLIQKRDFREITRVVNQNKLTKIQATTRFQNITNIIECCLILDPVRRKKEWDRIKYDDTTNTLFVEGATTSIVVPPSSSAPKLATNPDGPVPIVKFAVSNVLKNVMDAFDGKTESNAKPRPPHGFVNRYVRIRNSGLFYETDQAVLGAQFDDGTTMLMNGAGMVDYLEKRVSSRRFKRSNVPNDLKEKLEMLINSRSLLTAADVAIEINPQNVRQTFDVFVSFYRSTRDGYIFRTNASDVQFAFKNGVSIILSDEGRSTTFIHGGIVETELTSKLVKAQPKYMEYVRDALVKLKSQQQSTVPTATATVK